MLAVCLATLAPPAGAQVRLGVHTGVVASSNLLRDSIVQPFVVRPNLALALALSAETAVPGGYWAGGRLTVSRSDVEAHPSVQTEPVTTLTLWQPAVFLRHAVRPWLVAEARIGLLVYTPSPSRGTFFRDGGPVRPLVGLGIALQRGLSRRMALEVTGTYDVHQFTTTTLESSGFTGQTIVHRVGVLISVHRLVGDAPAR